MLLQFKIDAPIAAHNLSKEETYAVVTLSPQCTCDSESPTVKILGIPWDSQEINYSSSMV